MARRDPSTSLRSLRGGVYHEDVKNFELARLFYEMATLLEVKNASVFRLRAYQRAAQTLEALPTDIEAVAARGDRSKLPAIGKDLAAKSTAYLGSGRLARLVAIWPWLR